MYPSHPARPAPPVAISPAIGSVLDTVAAFHGAECTIADYHLLPIDSMGVGGSCDLAKYSDRPAFALCRRSGIVAGHTRRTYASIGHGARRGGHEPERDVLAADEYVGALFLHADRITRSLLARIGFRVPVDRYTGRLAPVGALMRANDPEREQGQETQSLMCVWAGRRVIHAYDSG